MDSPDKLVLPALGDVVGGKYRLDALVGEGGFGRVFRGVTLETGRVVALKVLKNRTDGLGKAAGRFRRELRAMASLESPHTPILFDYGTTEDGAFYMVTEYVDGEDLSELLARRQRLEEHEAIHILGQILSSLDEAHANGIVHRDIKPGNVRIFSHDGDHLRAKLLDFGIAKDLNESGPVLTRTGVVLGTPRYLAPELLHGTKPSAASDLFSVGLVARELVLGPASTQFRHFSDDHERVLLTQSDPVSRGFREAVNRMLARSPTNRFSTAREAREALLASLGDDVGVARMDAATVRSLAVGLADTLEAPAESVPTAPVVHPTTRAWDPPTRAHAVAETTRERSRLWLAVALLGVAGVVFVALVRHPPAQSPQAPRESAVPITPDPTSATVVSADRTDTRGDASCPGRTSRGFREGNTRGPWYAYVPEHLAPNPALLVLLRAKSVSAPLFLRDSGFVEVADEAGFVVVAPEDSETVIDNPWDEFDAHIRVLDVVEDVAAELCMDDAGVYIVGHGAGAPLAHRMGCQESVAGIAVSGTRRWSAPRDCARHAPAIWLDPKNSPRLPWEGGDACADYAFGVFAAEKPSHAESLNTWLQRMGCREDTRTSVGLENGACFSWECDRPFESCELDGGDAWPNMPPTPANCESVGADFPAARRVWHFFERSWSAHGRGPSQTQTQSDN